MNRATISILTFAFSAVLIPAVCIAGPATLVVTTLEDQDGTGEELSLREAIAASSEFGSIRFDSALTGQTITLTNGELVVDKALDIEGNVTVSGGGVSRVFSATHTSGTVSIKGLSIVSGFTVGDGGGILCNGGGKLWLVDTTIKDCTALNGGAMSVQGGSGADIERSLIQDNAAEGDAIGFSGGLDNFNGGAMLVSNSTITGNSCTGFGSGIGNAGTGLTVVVNCTIANNAGVEGGAGGGIYNSNSDGLRIGNSIVALNTGSDPSVANVKATQPMTSLGGNYIQDAADLSGFVNGTDGDQVGTEANPLPNVLNDLADNGGPTWTHALIFPSSAVDAGNQELVNSEDFPSGADVDQRGAGFLRHGVVDIGAVEVNPQTIVVTTLADDDNGSAVDGVSLREAIQEVPSDSTVNFSPDLTPDANVAVIQINPHSRLTINKPLIINGPGARRMSIRAGLNDRIFSVEHLAGNVKISGLTFTNGDAQNGGGAIRVTGAGTFQLLDCTISDCKTNGGQGAGIALAGPAPAQIERCSIVDNGFSGFVQVGGGVACTGGEVLISNSTISGNRANAAGGGIYSSASLLTIVNCTIVGNLIQGSSAGAAIEANGFISIGNSIVQGNNGTDEFVEVSVIGTLTSLGGNYIARYSGAGLTDGTLGDQVGTFASPLPAITIATLANNGGPTDTHALIFPSRGVGVGNQALVTLEYFPSGQLVDQTGEHRIGGVDIGAVEARPNLVLVTTKDDESDGVGFGQGVSLREAIENVNRDGQIVFDSSILPLYFFLSGSPLLIERPMRIPAPEGHPIVIDAASWSRAITINVQESNESGFDVSLSGLTITGGVATGIGDQNNGGGIWLTSGNVIISGCTIKNNRALFGGGLSIQNSFSKATIENSTISNNTSTASAAGMDVDSGAEVTLFNSTVSGNIGGYAGGVACTEANLHIASCTIVKNSADSDPVGAGGVVFNSCTADVADSIVQMNTLNGNPSDFFTSGTNTVTNNGGNYIDVGFASLPFSNGTNGDFVGTAAAPLAPAVENDLTNRGGPTEVHFPLNPGPAINTGKSTLTMDTGVDQRGSLRSFGGGHDIGAVEWSPFLMDGIPDALNCPAVDGFTVAENDGWLYVAGSRLGGSPVFVFLSDGPGPLVTLSPQTGNQQGINVAAWDYYYQLTSTGSFLRLYDAAGGLINDPDTTNFNSVTNTFGLPNRFELAVRKSILGGRRAFVSIAQIEIGYDNDIIAQYPNNNGPTITRGDYLPVITGYNTCTDLATLREGVVDYILGIPFSPPRSVPFTELYNTNGDLRIDATDVTYLER